jgi:hypothetical protein
MEKMKNNIVLFLLLMSFFSCGENFNSNAEGMKKASLTNRQWEAKNIDWFVGGPGFVIMTHRLNFFENDTFSWKITTIEIQDGENAKPGEIGYTGTYSIISDSGDRMVIELSGEDINYRATLDAERHLSIDNYGGASSLIFIAHYTF